VDKNEKNHDSYGSMSISRISTGGMDLFGSSIMNTSVIAIRINESSEVESFGKAKHRSKGRIIEVYLSPNQFSELITTMNVGEGVPCTINWIRGKGRIERAERTNRREVADSMLKEVMSKLLLRISRIRDQVEKNSVKKTTTKKDNEIILRDLETLESHFRSNIPFVEEVFNEVMDKSVVEAKSDIDSMVTGLINKLGIDSLNSKRNLLNE